MGTFVDVCSAPGNFEEVSGTFGPDNAVWIPVDVETKAYAATRPDILATANEFKKAQEALDLLPRPTAIVCKSARRAGAFYAAYNGVRNGWTAEQVEEDSKKHGKYMCRSVGCRTVSINIGLYNCMQVSST
jgi:protein tyrosine phosphatase (PTP) superfamily phosphohydrolase (DUF442 family)